MLEMYGYYCIMYGATYGYYGVMHGATYGYHGNIYGATYDLKRTIFGATEKLNNQKKSLFRRSEQKFASLEKKFRCCL